MSPEIKIVLYVFFAVSLFFLKSLNAYGFIFLFIVILFFRIPGASLKKGWIPIMLFLMFTFIGNVLFQQGRIVYQQGPFVITDEGIHVASVRTLRVFFLISGARILTATTELESLVSAMGRIVGPLEHLGIPVKEFFTTMGLSMKYLPEIREQIIASYREELKRSTMTGLWPRVKAVATFMIPLFIKSIQSPEQFFRSGKNHE